MRRYPTKRLHDLGSDRALCSAPLPPDDDDVEWVARGLTSSGDGSLMALTLRWLSALLLPWGATAKAGDRTTIRQMPPPSCF